MNKKIFMSFIISFVVSLFVVSLFNYVGVEFNEYPTKNIALESNTAQNYREISICWQTQGGDFLKIDYKNNSESICEDFLDRKNIQKERILFFEDYKITIKDINYGNSKTYIELKYLYKKPFVIIN